MSSIFFTDFYLEAGKRSDIQDNICEIIVNKIEFGSN